MHYRKKKTDSFVILKIRIGARLLPAYKYRTVSCQFSGSVYVRIIRFLIIRDRVNVRRSQTLIEKSQFRPG